MAFAAAVAMTITVVSRSVVFGMLTGVLMQPLLMAIRFTETVKWIPYVHLDNIQSRSAHRTSARLLQIALRV